MTLPQTQIEQELINDIKCDACSCSGECKGWRKTTRCFTNEQPEKRNMIAIGLCFKTKDNAALSVGKRRINGLQVFFAVDAKRSKISLAKLSQRLISATQCTYDANYGYTLTVDDINGKPVCIEHYLSRALMAQTPSVEPKRMSSTKLREILIANREVFDIPINTPAHAFFLGDVGAI